MSQAPYSALAQGLLAQFDQDPRGHTQGRRYIPRQEEAVELLRDFLHLLFPGYFRPLPDSLEDFLQGELPRLAQGLQEQLTLCLCYGRELQGSADVPLCQKRASRLALAFLESLPEIRQTLLEDAQAALDGDPAATNLDEVILAYPGFLAISVHRLAHRLHQLEVPMLPRIWSEWAHSRSGLDIHPGAEIGAGFFVDHATGAVIGATARLGKRVRMYQGTTLGALSLPRDASGRVRAPARRHPTIGDNVTLYANSVILGGETVIGADSIIGGSVFLTRSVPEGSRVILEPPPLRILTGNRSQANGEVLQCPIDFEI